MSPEVRAQPILRAYYFGFVAVLVGTFLPSKALGFVLPALFSAVMAWSGAISRDRIAAVVAGAVIIGMAYSAVLDEFLVANYVVAIVTFSSFLPLWLIRDRHIASLALQLDLLRACTLMMAFQGVVGIAQAFYGATQTGGFSGANGDYVQGTIYPHLSAENAFSNPMFATNMTFMILACLSRPETSSRRARMCLVIGVSALVVASVVHVLVFLIGAVIIAVVLMRNRAVMTAAAAAARRRIIVVVLGVATLSVFGLSDNVALVSGVAQRAFDLEAVDIPRAIMMSRVVTDLPEDEPLQPYIGLGPGQFSGRAALIMSGLYLGGYDNPKPLPLFSPQTTRLAYDYSIVLIIAMNSIERDIGSSQQPFFSYMTIYTECGVLGSAMVLWMFARIILRIRSRNRARADLRLTATLLCAGTLLLFFLGWQAPYWETPQAIFVGILLLKVIHANYFARVDADGNQATDEQLRPLDAIR